MTAFIKRVLLVGGDVVVLYLALFLALSARHGSQFSIETWERHLLPFTIVYIVWLLVLWSQNLYDIRILGNKFLFFQNLARALIINAFIAIVFFYFVPYFALSPKTILFLDLFFFAFLFSLWRYGFNAFMKLSRFRKTLLVIGENPETMELVEELGKNPQLGYRPTAIFITQENSFHYPTLPILKTREDFDAHIKQNPVDLVCFSREKDMRNLNLYSYIPLGVTFKRVSQLYEEVTGKIPVYLLKDLWFLENLNREEDAAYQFLKRAFDLVFASLLLLFVLPFWLIIAAAIKIEDKGPIFHKQTRVGKGRKPFSVIKFRTMMENAEKHGPLWSRENDPRITRVGGVLRNTLLDETPQLLLVVAGKMSLVGTRPERKEFVHDLEKQIPHYNLRHMIKPGLTGWAQIHFGYGSSVEDAIQKLQYELYYIKNRSLLLDLSILLKTINIAIERIIKSH